jgi:hypothetical protein
MTRAKMNHGRAIEMMERGAKDERATPETRQKAARAARLLRKFGNAG